MSARAQAKVSGNATHWVRAVADVIIEGGSPPPSRATVYKRAVNADDPSMRGDGRSTAALNGLPQSKYGEGHRIWIDEVIDELVQQGAVTEEGGELRWLHDLHRDMEVRFHGMAIRVLTPEEHQRGAELGAIDLTLRGMGHLNKVLIADGGGIPNNPRFRAGQRVALEVHPIAFELPPMTDAELERLAEDVKQHGIAMPLLLVPDHADPLREQRAAKPGQKPPLVLDKQGRPIPKLKVGDGRHRLALASRFDLPVRLELFDGTEQEARERVVSLNIHRRMLNPVQIGILIRQLLLPEEKRKAEKRREEGNRRGGEGGKSMANLPSSSPAPVANGQAEKAVLKRLGNPIGERTLRTLKETDDAPETRERAMRGDPGYRSASAVARKASEEKGQPAPAPQATSRGDHYSQAYYRLRRARQEFDPDTSLQSTITDRVEKLEAIADLVLELIMLEKGVN